MFTSDVFPPHEAQSMPEAVPHALGADAKEPSIADVILSELRKDAFVDAHNVQLGKKSLDEVAALVAKAMPYAMEHDEIFMRRQIAQTVVISMGNRIKAFEGKVDPITGIVDIDHVFEPIICEDEHLSDMHEYDPCSTLTKIKDCVVMRTYMTNLNPKTGDHTSLLLGCEPMDLHRLMTVSRDMSKLGTIHPSEYRQYDFCKFTNFCNTFTVVSVLPAGGGTIVAMGQKGYCLDSHPEPLSPDHYTDPVPISNHASSTTTMMHQLHVGLRLFTTAQDREAMSSVAACIQAELDKMEAGISLYHQLVEKSKVLSVSMAGGDAAAAGQGHATSTGERDQQQQSIIVILKDELPACPVHASLMPDLHFMPSILRSLPQIQTSVHLQQGLQYAYCEDALKAKTLLVVEPHAMQFTPTATSYQTHMASICFTDMSRNHRLRYAPVPMDQIMVQFFAAINTAGIDPDEILHMNASEHVGEAVALYNAIFSAGQLDQVQTPYYSDYVLHSYEPADEQVAKANLKPVQGILEYAPGCNECIYRLHSVYSAKKDAFQQVHVRYNLAPSEDLKQPRTCKTLESIRNCDDCETQAQDQIATILSAMRVYQSMKSAPPDARLNEYINPALFGHCSIEYQAKLFRAFVHLFSLATDMHPYSNIGNARAPKAGMSNPDDAGQLGDTYCGHSYPGVMYMFPGSAGATTTNSATTITGKADLPAPPAMQVRCILEGTRWVNSMMAYTSLASSMSNLHLEKHGGSSSSSNSKKEASSLPLPFSSARIMGNASVPGATIASMNMLGTILQEMTKTSADDIGIIELEMFQDAETGFYANTYVLDDMVVSHESIPGVPHSARILGAPVPYTTHNVPSLHLTVHNYSLVTKHLVSEGITDLGPTEIKDNVTRMAMEEAMPPWDAEDWQQKVFSRYLPCATLYEDKSLRHDFQPGKHHAISFTHQLAKGMTMEKAKEFAGTVLSVLRGHQEPCITAVHAARIKDPALYPPCMPQDKIAQIKVFDPAALNQSAKQAFASVPENTIRVENISTAMGCLIVTCIVDIQPANILCAGLTNWIRPIAEAYKHRQNAALEWRQTLEARPDDPNADDRSLLVRVVNVESSIGTIHPSFRTSARPSGPPLVAGL